MNSKCLLSFLCFIFIQTVWAQDSCEEYIEFKKGQYTKYNCKGEGSANGLNFSIKYPNTWILKDGDRPHIVKNIMGKLEGLVIYVNKLSESDLPKEDVSEFFTLEGLKYIIGVDEFDSYDLNQEIDGIRTACVYFNTNIKRLDTEIKSKNLVYLMIYKNYLIQLHFSVTAPPPFSNFFEKKFKRYEGLFKLMANSFIINSQWTSTPVSNNSTLNKINEAYKKFNSNKLSFSYLKKYNLTEKRYTDNVNVVLKYNKDNVIVNLNSNYTHNSVYKIDRKVLKQSLVTETKKSLKKINFTGNSEVVFLKDEIKKIHNKELIKITSKTKYEGKTIVYQIMYIYLYNNKSCFITLTSNSSIERLNQVDKDVDILLKTLKILN
ncbi:hypothetical protein FRY74_06325 [Vicingus serpentipes]|uniref:DUF1795 domain-containing protein n=1 Tax=Vicingus serpentipes TaxID=1926625 RepID=A0A5C6RW66_9FLAO|nr:hypothetical protein [Vicingus serpentipes]TXB66185.1 hypothetical protein FRY74_06325 [Vicingus serpentipes]